MNPSSAAPDSGSARATTLLRVLADAMAGAVLLFLFNSYLTFWHGAPGVPHFFANRQWFGMAPLSEPLEGAAAAYGWIQFLFYPTMLAAVIGYVYRTPHVTLRAEAERLTAMVDFIIRTAFWAVLLIGLADMLISAARIEGFLNTLVGDHLTDELGRSVFRGTYVHYPLLIGSMVIAFFNRSLGFHWLALLVVMAEFLIVLSRFIFSYEQAYMGDLVRFWYAALFLFASAYTLLHEGHVRVDVFYANFTKRGQARTNIVGSVALGLPVCWVILTMGMWDRGSSLISPLRSFEISQSGFGMYVKYLMAGFLVIYATTMAIQFCSYFLRSVADFRGEPRGAAEEITEEEPVEV